MGSNSERSAKDKSTSNSGFTASVLRELVRLGPRPKDKEPLQYVPALDGITCPDFAKSADVNAALTKLEELDKRLPDAIHDWLIKGKSLRTVSRDYGIRHSTLQDAKRILREELRDYDRE